MSTQVWNGPPALKRCCLWWRLGICTSILLGLLPLTLHAGFLQIRNGYFWDPSTQDYFLSRGIAYQTWNPPVGANQTFEQFDYDFIEFKKMYANSVRAEFVWNEVEKTQGVMDWSKPDHMVAKAEELGLKLFILVGFQYAPDWFPDDWKAINDLGQRSVVLNYEHPQARAAYSNYISQAANRYKNSAAIGGWIVGNEYAYFDLWEPDHHFLGYDPLTQGAFRSYLMTVYTNRIASLNSNWGTSYTSFTNVVMPASYPGNRQSPAWFDLLQWRKKSIGDYVALGAIASKKADPNHLRTYSMVGGIFSGDDALNTCEDAKTIVAESAAAGAPLDFWSINNYAWASMGSELRSADYGIAKYQQISGLPVMISETGHSSTENLFAGAAERQGKAVPSQIWESAFSGAIGVHLFHWSDRDLFGGLFIREKGFGIVNQDRTIKDPVYWNTLEAFRRMENLNISHLIGGSSNPKPDIQFFWPLASDMGWPRANQENAMLWGALRRLGFQPALLNDAQFARGDYTNARALVLSRCFQMEPGDLERIATNVIPAGVNVHANADLPGQVNTYQKPNTNWLARMSSLFGLNVANAYPGYDLGITYIDYNGTVNFTGTGNLGSFTNGYHDHLGTWKIWHGLTANSGSTIVTHTGNNASQPSIPALQVKNLGPAKTAINTFALADTFGGIPDPPAEHLWDIRTTWLKSIYRSWFGLSPAIDLSGTGAQYVLPDYRVCRNGSILIGLLNEHTNSFTITLAATNLIAGKTIENLTTGGILETNSDGVITLAISGDEYVLLYAYTSTNGLDDSLVSQSPNKIWIQTAPVALWPNGSNCNVTVGFDVGADGVSVGGTFERVLLPNKVYGQAPSTPVSGRGSQILSIPIPDPDPNDIDYISSREGGRYVFHVWLEKNGLRLADSFLPVRLLWGVHPLASLPTALAPGSNYLITLGWQELPSYDPAENGLPLNRALLWEQFKASQQYYNVVLELRSGPNLVASANFLTCNGTDQHTFSIRVPTNATGPFTWTSYLQATPGASADLTDSFENRGTGNDQGWFAPWTSYAYAENNNSIIYAQGVDNTASAGAQGLFMVVQNPPNPGAFSGFGVRYVYDQPWSLPHDARLWTNYLFSADFREASGYHAILELQVQDTRGGEIHFTKNYVPGTNQWGTIRASLDQFAIPPWVGYFDSSHVQQLIVNIQMLDSNEVYQGSIDNIHFDGPESIPMATPYDYW
ncbi:MAG TPA: beta-galactosidase, partial [Verrucomicrobiae bacterium]